MKETFARFRCSWQDNVKIDIEYVGEVGYSVHSVQE
jgi:hypothetical protein